MKYLEDILGFFREDALKSGTFPWSIAIEERQNYLIQIYL